MTGTRVTAVALGVVTMIMAHRACAQPTPGAWHTLHSVQDVCRAYPNRLNTLFSTIDLTRPGLETARAAVHRNNLPAACTALLAYYRNGGSGDWLRGPAVRPGTARDDGADALVAGRFTFYRQTAAIRRRDDGGLDWSFRGPAGDREWAWALNRHYHVRQLLAAYTKTGNPLYAETLDAHLRDWVVSSLPYPRKRSGTAMWRGLEVSFRVKTWAEVFYALQQDDLLLPATRLLLLTSLPEHAHYLRHFHAGGNWVTMEHSALAILALAWPEFGESSAWLEYTTKTLTRELDRQVYPDGVQKELTSHYHWVALANFNLFAGACRDAEVELPPQFAQGLERMWNYLAYAMRPDGYGPMNNDSDRDENRGRVAGAAKTWDRPDWAHIASNGTEGTAPEGGPSRVFPWAGQLIMRNGWETDADWAFFDIGPWGIGHQHNDKLHVSVAVAGRDVLVDSGRFAYQGRTAARFRGPLAVHSRGHNVILIDGHGQGPGPRETREPLLAESCRTTSDFDYARGGFAAFAGLEGTAVHTRAILYRRGTCWIVIDRIDTDRPRTLEALWHFHPHCTVTVHGNDIASTDADDGNIRIVPLGPITWRTRIVEGQDKPVPQGWYSEKYNSFEPSPTAVCTGAIDEPATFGWVLLPATGTPPPAQATLSVIGDDAMVTVTPPDGPPWHATVPLAGPTAPGLSDTNR